MCPLGADETFTVAQRAAARGFARKVLAAEIFGAVASGTD
jgi:hypothetical protein